MPPRALSPTSEADRLRAELVRTQERYEREQAAHAKLSAQLADVVTANGKLATTVERLTAEIAKLRAALEAARGGAADAPSTPSGQIPVYLKPERKKSSRKPGQKAGHPGRGGKKPAEVDRQESHTLDECPHCTGPVQPVKAHNGS